MNGDARLVRALLACYPAAWRRRYGDEYAQLLCDLRIARRPALILDSLRGAVRAHGGVLMARRSPMTVAVWATGLFTVAGLGFQKLSEDFTGVAGGTYALLVAAAVVALVGLAVAAAPTAAALLQGRGRGAWKYLAIPVVGVAAWFGVVRLAVVVSGNHGVHSAPTIVGFLVIIVAGLAVVAATARAATTVLNTVPAAPSIRLRRAALIVVAVGMAVTTVAALSWGLQVRTGDPSGFRGDRGILATPFVPSWIVAVVMMALATGLTAAAAQRQLTEGPATAAPATGSNPN